MKIEVSIGEAIDKYSILDLKLKKIKDEHKKREIQKEMHCLDECSGYIKQYSYFYQLLMYVNEKIWDLTDIVKTNPTNYSEISKQIFDSNQQRFRIKHWFNLITNSNLKEQKSYATTQCYINVDESTFYSKLPQVCYLALQYDSISINQSNILNIPTITNESTITNNDSSTIVTDLNFEVPSEFTIPAKSYIVGGMLGDCIQSLSVICENYYKTGSKGILFISEYGEKFRNGLLNTYNELYPIIMKQQYIQDFKIYNNEPFDINLIQWRNLPNLFSYNWYTIYSSIYNIEWGKKKWLEWNYNSFWNNKTVINTTDYRFPEDKDFFKKYDTDCIFISSDIKQYEYFKTKTGTTFEYYEFKTLDELVTIINSCKLFIGGFSAPLAIANALHKNRIICNSSDKNDITMNDLKNHLPNIIQIV
jgi:hypothetical protein